MFTLKGKFHKWSSRDLSSGKRAFHDTFLGALDKAADGYQVGHTISEQSSKAFCRMFVVKRD
jgi:hypothetical protein